MDNKKRLTPEEIDLYPEYLDDRLALLMYNVENALKSVGAKPIKDYSYSDLMEWAINLMDGNTDEFKIEWVPRNKNQ